MENQFSIAVSIRSNELWEKLSTATIADAAHAFLGTLASSHTQRSYRRGFQVIFEIWESKQIFQRNATLQALVLSNLENLLDCIQDNVKGAVATIQNRCAVFISFTRYLERVTGGMVRMVKPKAGSNPTFRKIREKAYTKAISHEDWSKFIAALRRNSMRDSIIARMIFQGAKRCSEVLSVRISDIEWKENRISFHQSKSRVIEKKTIITYSKEFMDELRLFLGERSDGLVFISRTGNPVTQPHVYRSFAAASEAAKLNVHVHPHMLRTSAITLYMKMGYHSDQIMRVSGHSSPQAVLYYDKTPEEENITTQAKLV